MPLVDTRGPWFPVSDRGRPDRDAVRVAFAGCEPRGRGFVLLSYAERIVNPDRTQDFKIRVFDLDTYLTLLPSTLDHVLVSASGSWGVYVLHSGVAVVAGDGDFVARLYADLPPPVEQAVGFVREIRSMRSEHTASWARNLLADVLGAAVASEIWETAT